MVFADAIKTGTAISIIPLEKRQSCSVLKRSIAGKHFYKYTNGYPFLVSRILLEKNTLFDSLMNKVYDNSEMKNMLERMLFAGDIISYNPDVIAISDAEMYGFIRNDRGNLAVANRIFEVRLYNYFLSSCKMQESPLFRSGANEKMEFIKNGRLQMEYLLERFITIFGDLYRDEKEQFDEAEGRRRFLLSVRSGYRPVHQKAGAYFGQSTSYPVWG